MAGNTIGRLYQAGRNTVKAKDFIRPDKSQVTLDDPLTLPAVPQPALQAARKRRIENFLTETMCMLVWADWRPMERALSAAGLAKPGVITFIEPSVQARVGMPGCVGTVDLVLALEPAGQEPQEIWFEVKAGAGVHGDQLTNYRVAIRDAADATEYVRWLVIVDYESAKPVTHTRRLTWQQLHDVIGPTDGRLWRDFAEFLVDQELASDPKATLLGNVVTDDNIVEVLADVLQPRPDWPAWLHWDGKGESMRHKTLKTALRTHYRDTGERAVRLFADGQHTSLTLGAFVHDNSAFGVQLTVSNSYPIVQSSMRRAVSRADLDRTEWDVPSSRDRNAVAATYKPIGDVFDPESVAEWMIAQISALKELDLLADRDATGAIVDQTD